MSDHQTSYTINSMFGRLYLKNQAFQSLTFTQQQSIILDILTESHNSDVNMGEMLGNECFSDYKDINENRTIATIFQVCGFCGKAKDGVKDYGDDFIKQGYCPDCVDKYNLE